MTIPSISPAEAQARLADGAVLVDIRNREEHAREHIPGAVLWPVAHPTVSLPRGTAKTLIFHCRSGARTQAAAARLVSASRRTGCTGDAGSDLCCHREHARWMRRCLPV